MMDLRIRYDRFPRAALLIVGYGLFLTIINQVILTYLKSGKTVFIDETKYDKKKNIWVRKHYRMRHALACWTILSD